jgi:hypothetical protein
MSTFSFQNGWRPFPMESNKKLGCYPNQFWRTNDRKIGALVVIKGWKYEEFALSKIGLDHLHDALRAKRIDQAIVVLGDWRDRVLTVISQKPIADVIASLANLTPRDGPFGPYYWMKPDFSPYAPDLGEADQF